MQRMFFFSSDRDGKIVAWHRNGTNIRFIGIPHKSRVFGLSVSDNYLVSISLDDTVKFSSISNREWGSGVSLSSQPTGLASSAYGSWTVVSTRESVVLFRGAELVSDTKLSWGPTCVAISKDGGLVAIGGADRQIHVFNNADGSLTESHAVTHNGALSCVAISDEGGLVAGGDTDRDVCVWDGTNKISRDFGHSARVDKVRFTPGSGEYLLSASLDSSFILWNITTGKRVVEQRNAHNGGVKDVVFIDHQSFLTTGQDIMIKGWSVRF